MQTLGYEIRHISLLFAAMSIKMHRESSLVEFFILGLVVRCHGGGRSLSAPFSVFNICFFMECTREVDDKVCA